MFVNFIFDSKVDKNNWNFGGGNIGNRIKTVTMDKVEVAVIKLSFDGGFEVLGNVIGDQEGIRTENSREDLFDIPGLASFDDNNLAAIFFNIFETFVVAAKTDEGDVIIFGEVFYGVI